MKSFALLFFLISGFYACSNPKLDRQVLSIELLPFNGFDTSLIPNIRNKIQTVFKCEVHISQIAKKPSNAYYTARQRYRADSLLKYLNKRTYSKPQFTIGLIGEDISISINGQKDWGVFGLAYCPGASAIISSFRLGRDKVSKGRFLNRIERVTLHEFGHNLGLPHCQNKSCLMQDAKGKMASSDIQNKLFCPSCHSKIKQFLHQP